jgi:transcriptional regulator with XRE-family HTH domain
MDWNTNERITLLRKELKLSQTEFGERIGVSRGVIKNIDDKNVIVKPLLIQQICKEYNVNRIWLETGEGEMFEDISRDEEIALRVGQILSEDDDSFKKQLIGVLTALDDDEWELLRKMAAKLLEAQNKKEGE